MTFELPLSEERIKSHQVTALHLFVAFIIVVTAAVILAAQYSVSRMPIEKAMQFRTILYYGQAAGFVLMAAGLGLLLIAILKSKVMAKSPVANLLLRVVELIVLIVLLVLAVKAGLTVPAVVYGVLVATIIFAIYWERLGNKPLVIRVDNTGVRLPLNARKRFINWADIDYVLLRFGTLTVNLHDNSMMQWNVGNLEFEKELFDVYCIRQIEKAKDQRPKNNW